MKKSTTRRSFLASLGLVAAAPIAALAQSDHHKHLPSPSHHPGTGMSKGHGRMGTNHAWRDPKMPLSPPPRTMGQQMGRVNTLNVPPLGYEMDGDIKVFHVIAQPVRRLLTDGHPKNREVVEAYNRFTGGMHHNAPKPVKLWGYNGQVPGPTIECRQGDTIRVVMKNELPEPTSIHWHGLEVPNEMDGAGGTTEPVTPPGGTRIYEFTLHQNGTFMYHTGFNMMKQDGLGLGGFVVVHPKEEQAPPDVDVAVMLHQLALLPGNDYPNLATMDFNWFTFNSKVAPDIDVIRAKQDQKVRLRFGNLSMNSHPIHIHGYAWKVVGTDGGPIPDAAQWPGSTINVPPGTTRDVEFKAWNPGVWRLHCHKLHHTMNAHAEVPLGIMSEGGMFTLVYVEPKDKKGDEGREHHG